MVAISAYGKSHRTETLRAVRKLEEAHHELMKDDSLGFHENIYRLLRVREKLLAEFSISKEDFVEVHHEFRRLDGISVCQPLAPKVDIPMRNNWMGELNGNIKLHSITLPGTHDAGAFNLTTMANKNDPAYVLVQESTKEYDLPATIVAEIVCKFSLTQTKTIREQLDGGIRYLDLRVDYDPSTSTYKTFHLLFGNDAKSTLLDVANFLKENVREIVVIEMTQFYTNVDASVKADFQQFLTTTFEGLLYPATNGNAFDKTIGEMVNANYRLILVVEDSDIANHENIWPSTAIVNTYANSPNVTTMIEFNANTLNTFKARTNNINDMYKMSWTLTPDIAYIQVHALSPGGLYGLSKLGNAELNAFVNSHSETKQFGQLLIIDYFEESTIMTDLNISVNESPSTGSSSSSKAGSESGSKSNSESGSKSDAMKMNSMSWFLAILAIQICLFCEYN